MLIEGIKNVGQEIHPGTLPFGSRLIAGIDPISTAGVADIVTGSGP